MLSKFPGMASLYSTVALAVIRLIIVKNSDNSWLERCNKFSFQTTSALIAVWLLALIISVPPLLGFGRFGQDMVGVR